MSTDSQCFCSLKELKAAVSSDAKDLRFALNTLLDTRSEELSGGQVVVLLLYDILQQVGFDLQKTITILKFYKEPLLKLGDELACARTRKKVTMLMAFDSNWVSLSSEKGLLSLTTGECEEQCPQPIVSLCFALPTLFHRFSEALQYQRHQHAVKAG